VICAAFVASPKRCPATKREFFSDRFNLETGSRKAA
jgi:hypothetical protein